MATKNFETLPINRQDEQPKPKKEIQYLGYLNFRPADGNFDILKFPDRKLTNDDVANGIYSPQEKMDFSFSKLLKGLPLQLRDLEKEMPADRKLIVESLRAGKPTFIPLDKAEVDEIFVQASEQFPGAQIGVILFPESNKVMNQLSAIKYPDGRIARMLRGGKCDNLDDFVDKVNILTPRMEAKEIIDEQGEKKTAYAREFVDGERPKKITQQEMDSWLAKSRKSGLIFGFDVGEDDSSLDNFIRIKNELFWIDGNILMAKPAQNKEELNSFIEQQRKTLTKYINL